MAGDGRQGGGGHDPEPTAEECVRAGMYWFGRSDFVAAQAWWERAVELDPRNTRAQECLRLLDKTSSTGFKTNDINPFSDTSSSGFGSQAGPQTSDLGVAPGLTGDVWSAPSSSQRPAAPASSPAQRPINTDPFAFAADAQSSGSYDAATPSPPPVKQTRSPWDEGPSRTSVVTLQDSGGFDAVPEPTPLPEIDRERFFGRGDPESREEIVSFLKATGDLPYSDDIPREAAAPTASAPAAPPAPSAPPPDSGGDSGEIVFDDPVELAGAAAPAAPDPQAILQEARDCFGLHDFDGVLDRLARLPEPMQQSDEARNLAAEARRNLLGMYESKIGDFERVPGVKISESEVIWLNLDHRAGFILSQIDGAVTYEDLVSLSGMPRLDTVRILADLLDKNVIG